METKLVNSSSLKLLKDSASPANIALTFFLVEPQEGEGHVGFHQLEVFAGLLELPFQQGVDLEASEAGSVVPRRLPRPHVRQLPVKQHRLCKKTYFTSTEKNYAKNGLLTDIFVRVRRYLYIWDDQHNICKNHELTQLFLWIRNGPQPTFIKDKKSYNCAT